MTDSQDFLRQIKKNLNTLREREAKYGREVPLPLLNQIEDHEQAITLTEQLQRGELSQADWQAALAPLLIAVAPFRAAAQIVGRLTPPAAGGEAPGLAALRHSALAPLLRSDQGALIVAEFEQDPDTYAWPLIKALAQALVSDAALAAELKARLQALGPTATLTGSGSLAQGTGAGAASASSGGIAIGGSVGGDVTVGQPPEAD